MRFIHYVLFVLLLVFLCGCSAQEYVSSTNTKYVDCSGMRGHPRVFEANDELISTHTQCGKMDRHGLIQINSETISLVKFKLEIYETKRPPKDLLCLPLKLQDTAYSFLSYVDSNGRARPADYPYDAECQPFKNNVAVGYVDNKAVYFDENLDVVNWTNYVLADPFYQNLSRVCIEMPTKKYGAYNEHFEWVGGKCGFIDDQFNEVVPTIYPAQDVPRLTGGKYEEEEPDPFNQPNPFHKTLVNFLHGELETQSSITSFTQRGGCVTNSSYCLRRFHLLAQDVNSDDWVMTLEFELKDLTKWKGVVRVDVKGNMKALSLKEISSNQSELP